TPPANRRQEDPSDERPEPSAPADRPGRGGVGTGGTAAAPARPGSHRPAAARSAWPAGTTAAERRQEGPGSRNGQKPTADCDRLFRYPEKTLRCADFSLRRGGLGAEKPTQLVGDKFRLAIVIRCQMADARKLHALGIGQNRAEGIESCS